jgi:hypothetical protein
MEQQKYAFRPFVTPAGTIPPTGRKIEPDRRA